MEEIAIELRTCAAADRLRQGLVSHGYTVTADGHEVQVTLARKTRALSTLLSDHEWLAEEPEAHGLVRLGGRSYIFEHRRSGSSPDLQRSTLPAEARRQRRLRAP
jgi:hypothetical protein